jgi:hypothetical protein
MNSHSSRQYRIRAALAVIALFGCLSRVHAQPTYQLDVKAHLKPLATLTLKGAKLSRSAVKDDPGFRLQYHFQKAGKTVAVVEARSNPVVDVPPKAAGTYTVVLELFYPAYKGGILQKGQFKAVSNVLTFRVEPGAKPSDPVKVVLVEPPRPALPAAGQPALVIQCGKGAGKLQDELVLKGYGYKLLQGAAFAGWPKTAARTYCWYDARLLRFEVTVPPATAGILRLHLVDGDNLQRKEKVTVQGQPRGDFEAFGGAGKKLDVALTAADTRVGKIDVVLQNLNPAVNAVVSTVEFIPAAVARGK